MKSSVKSMEKDFDDTSHYGIYCEPYHDKLTEISNNNTFSKNIDNNMDVCRFVQPLLPLTKSDTGCLTCTNGIKNKMIEKYRLL